MGGSAPRGGPLPVETTTFVDRHHELAEGRRLLTRSRLVTLTGPGGVGKTRLAARLAARTERAFPDGVRFVPLSGLHDPALVPLATAEALGLREHPRDDLREHPRDDPRGNSPTRRPSLDALVQHVRDRRLLLVLDNCEHLLPACVDLAAALLRGTTGIRILATSRHRLALTEEHLLEVRPLPVPDPDGDLSDTAPHPALALFADRAAAVVPGFTLTPANRASVARLCRRLDGLPLAIELAAVRLRVLGVDQLLERLERLERFDDRYRLLAAGSPGVPPRHRTLRAAVDWSHDLCTPEERTVWAHASVLPSAFDLETAESVCAYDGEAHHGGSYDGEAYDGEAHHGGSYDGGSYDGGSYDVLEAVAGLVDKSVLVREEHRDGTVRYRLLDSLRHYGLDLLRRTPGAEAAARRRQRDWTQRRATAYERAWSEPNRLNRPNQREIAARLRADQDDLRTALEFSLSTPGEALAGLRLAGSLWFYWHACGAPREGRYWLDRALEAGPEPTPERARALWAAGLLLTDCPEAGTHAHRRARRLATEARELALTLGESTEAAHAEHVLGRTLLLGDDLPAALAHYEAAVTRTAPGRLPGSEALQALQALDRIELARALALLGHTDRAVDVCEQTLRRCERQGEEWVRSYALRALALTYTVRKEWRRAESHAREALRRGLAVHDVTGLALTLDLLIAVTTARGAHERAAVLLGGVDRIRADLSDHHRPTPTDAATDLRRSLGRALFERAHRRGRTMALDEIVSYALQQRAEERPEQPSEGLEPSAEGPEPPAPLTARETEVALLVAEGLANQQIADRLVIARRTAEGHVERILSKLGFHNRSQIAAWATAQTHLTARR
ncbi:ATP-binding protein [Streptomyces tailanensis]|uniref:ATP-binding protein n=1 Tax=Streptomyces tailanensis TaxID=2569858 RepID=UPI00122DCAC0|nr:LuxR C-terminal-related transcriptional regulator [Streptomyces tailanensis]